MRDNLTPKTDFRVTKWINLLSKSGIFAILVLHVQFGFPSGGNLRKIYGRAGRQPRQQTKEHESLGGDQSQRVRWRMLV